MLKKIYKYEMGYMFKRVGMIYVIGVLAIVFSIILLKLNLNNEAEFLGSSFIVIAMLSVVFAFIGVFAGTIGLVITRFYKNMFSDQGYLTFTLPVKPTEHLYSKWVIAVLISITNIVFVIVGFDLVLTLGLGEHSFIKTTIELIQSLALSITDVLILVAFSLISIFNAVGIFFLAICIGQSFKKKIEGAIVSFIILYIIEQIIGICTLGIVGILYGDWSNVGLEMTVATESGVHMGVQMQNGIKWLSIDVIVSLIVGIAYFLICRYIVNKKLNLE